MTTRALPIHTKPHDAGWTDERIARLIDLWIRGFTAAQIMRDLGGGVTRSAICGKVRRLNLPPRAVPERKPPAPRKPRTRAKPKLRVVRPPQPVLPPPVPFVAAPESVEPLMIGLLDLTEHTCKYPINDRHPYLFCGHPTRENSPYCQAHHLRCNTGIPK